MGMGIRRMGIDCGNKNVKILITIIGYLSLMTNSFYKNTNRLIEQLQQAGNGCYLHGVMFGHAKTCLWSIFLTLFDRGYFLVFLFLHIFSCRFRAVD